MGIPLDPFDDYEFDEGPYGFIDRFAIGIAYYSSEFEIK